LSRIVLDRPWVTLKLASSFDGRIATSTGESQWITSPLARRMVHALRASHDAVMIGGGTARADDPSLTIREIGTQHQPVRVVLSRTASLHHDSRLMATARDVPVWLVHGQGAPRMVLAEASQKGVTLIEAPVQNDTLDLAAVLSQLGQAGLTRIFCEGGGQLAASLLKAGLVDELIGFTAGMILGADGTPSVAAMGLDRLEDAPRFDLYRSAQIGPDVLQIWHRA
jgi:diaminohydroxyphosphoribosylaminopyrimidine deaminase/5-amino-6-(5-phosphoribosylamino)uracil reductase